ncbi:MAG TPA: Calx-beta domain-containing protein, partial [Verrucomicrobiae bacterium]|nr:Calx-beta domain-containing protein [Verrucomicrobiae bacterium]
LPIYRLGDTLERASVRWRTEGSNAVADVDFLGQTNVVTFEPGETVRWVEVPLLNDAVLESQERFRVVLMADAGQLLSRPSAAEAVILDNEYPMGFTSAQLDVNDLGQDFVRVSIQRGGDFGLSTVDLVTVDLGSAQPNVDYTPRSVTVTFAPGENQKTVDIPILRDDLIEGIEQFGLNLRQATGATPLGYLTNAVVRIHDEDSVIEILGAGWNSEDLGTIPVTLIRSGLAQQTATVQFRTANGTATSGQDFVGTNGVATFQPGESVKVIEIPLLNDGLVEGTETFSVVLSNPTGGARLGATSSFNLDIGDNDAGIEFTASEFYVSERGRALVSLRRNDDGTGPLSVGYTLLPQTALPGVDYVPQNGVLTLAPGETNATLSVVLIDNRTPGEEKSFQVKLTDPGPGASLGQQSTATVHIIDDDRPGSVLPLRQETWPHYDWSWGTAAGSVSVSPGRKAVVANFFDYWRINSDGSLDPTFQRIDLGGVTGALLVSLQPDGKVLIGGTTSNYVGGAFCLNRVDAAGARDLSFRPGVLNGSVRAIALVQDGRILIGGDFAGAYPFEGFTNGEALLRLLPDGTLDPAFRAPSFQSDRSFFSFRSVVRSVARQTDGRIVAGGSFHTVNGVPRSNLARLSADGVLEATFFSPSPNGPSLLDGPLNAVTVQADAKILIGGSFGTVRGVARPGLARLLPSGEVDLTFVPSLASGSHSAVVKVQPDGRILVGGGNSFTDFDPAPPFIVRLEANGTLDTQFNTSVDDTVLDLALLDGGDVLIAGAFNVVNGIPQPRLTRLQGGFVTQFAAPDPQRAVFPLRLSAWPGARYVLESSWNLGDWRPVRTNAAMSSLLEFAAPVGPLDPSHQFYRARLLEP